MPKKIVMRVLPKHKHELESLFEYNENADEDYEGLEDSDKRPPVKRMCPSESEEENFESEEKDGIYSDDLEDI